VDISSKGSRVLASTADQIVFVDRGDRQLSGTLYRPSGPGPFPAIVAVHGGGWRLAPKDAFAYLGPWLAARGYVVFAPSYRLADAQAASYPAAVHDIRAALQFLRARAEEYAVVPERLALLGESSGGHLACLAALAGDRPSFTDTRPNSALEEWPSTVKAAIAVYGIFDLAAQWQHDQRVRFDDHIVERFLGERLTADRQLYFDASPLSYVTSRRKETAFLLSWGTHDDVVEPATQSEAFLLALKQAGQFVRAVPVAGAGHYWLSEPLDEPGSFSGFFARRLERFLAARL